MSYSPTGKNLDPEFNRERARKAAAARHSTEGLVRSLTARDDAEFTPEVLDALRRLLVQKGGATA